MSIREQLIEAVKEVSQDNATSTLLVEKVLSGDVNLTPAEAQEVQAVLEAAKALLASQPEAMGAIESIETALRPVIAANVLETVAANTPGTSTTNVRAGVQSVTFSPESSSENSVANAIFSTSRQVTSNLGSGLEAHNANILTPFVQQVVGADGNLGGSVRVSGQVGNLADLSAQQNAGNVGSGSVARLLDGVKIVDTEKPVEVPPPPTLPPIGKVFIKADQESVLEQSEGLFRTISFTVTRSDATGKAAVAWKAEGIDLQDLASGGKLDGKVEFAPGQRTAKIEFVVRGDNLQESHETITVQLGTTEGFLDLGGGPSKASTVISNDDGIFSVSAAKDSQLEGGKDEAPELIYKITRTDTTSISSVKWRLEGLNPKDFANEQLPFGELQFAAGQLEAVVTIKLKGDDIVEPSLTAKIVLFDPGVNATLSSSAFSSETLIRNDDSVTSVRAVRAEQLEGQPGHTPVLEYIVERTDTMVSTTIDWKLEGLNPADFGGALPTGQVFLAAGQSSATVRIFTKPDYEIEPDETAVITLVEHGKNTTIDPLKNTAQTIIRTDDQGFVVKAVDAEKIEGKLGTTTTATFRIIRDGDLENPASVGWQVAGLGDGISGQNFSGGVMPSGTVQFAAFETEKMIEVVLAGNDIAAPDKSYQVLLKDPSSGNRIIIGSAEGKILDDDATVQVKAIASEIPEGNTGVSIAKFEILRTNKLGAEQTVKWSLRAAGELPIKADDFSEGTAMSGEVVFAPNQSVFILEVPIKSDSVSEGNKLFTLDLQDEDGNNLSLGQSRAQITILSDDSAILVRAQATDLLEGSSSDTARTHEFVIERSRNFGETFTVNWQVKGVGDTPVDAADFGGTLPSGTVTFGPQDTQKIVSFTPTPDQMLETDEHFLVEISTTASGVEVIGATARGTVMDDEASFQFTQAEWSVSEGDSGEITLQAVVQRTGFVLQNGTVKWRLNPFGDNPVSLEDLLADQDKAGDNGGFPSGTLSFEVGQSSALIEVKIRPDSVQELNETFRLQLSDPGVGHILGSVTQATGIIVNDDSTFSIAGPQTVIEGPAGAGNTATFVVTRSGSLEGADSVKWRVVFPDGGATAADFTGPVSGVLQFATVSATQNIVLQMVGDDVFESNENFSVELYEPSLGTLVSGTQGISSSSIVNDDSRVTLQGVTISALEGNAQNGIFTYKAVREGNLNSEISVNWEITGSGNNPAVASDFVAMTGTVVIAAGASEGTFTVSTVSDNKLETTEGFTVLLKAPNAGSGFLLGDAVSVVSEILNDDQKVSIADATPMQELAEGSTVNHVFTITREGPIESAATLNWRVDGVTATAADFPGGVLPTGQVEFLANQATATVTVAVA
ncbi:MAG: hypothetical protein H3C47_15820, partial [Candidatus Cloacimonetes bacterium]|nr:hypothetical protein [Candidatus Cloacimonadota bacterium]